MTRCKALVVAAIAVVMPPAARGFVAAPKVLPTRAVVRTGLLASRRAQGAWDSRQPPRGGGLRAATIPLDPAVRSSARVPAVVEGVKPTDEVSRVRWKKKTKQVATLGPASCTKEMIEKLFLAGVDVFRLNFSHGAHEEKAELMKVIRKIEEEYRHPIGVLADLQGPKLRVGVFEHDTVTLVDGQSFRFDMDEEPGDAVRVQLPHKEIIETLDKGDVLLLDDGKLKMTVTGRGESHVDCHVDVGGKLSNRKGVNTPTVRLPISPLTPKDRKDLDFALSIHADIIALSFVQKPEDIVELKSIVKGRAKVMAKIEKPQAVNDLEQIVELCDAIMVARGDLGVEMAPEDVPVCQKQIIDCCRTKGKPVVVATQMLESMIENPTPTRAEASDVATAIYDGADGIMLSAESAAGKFPEESVNMQQRIITRVESDPLYQRQVALRTSGEGSAAEAITRAAAQVADTLQAAVIIVFTSWGTTVLKAAQLRPQVPVMGVTPNIETARGLALTWGVYPAVIDISPDATFKDMLYKVCDAARGKKLTDNESDLMVVTAGLPFNTHGVSNILRVVPAAGPDIWDPTLTSDVSSDGHTESYVNYNEES